MPEVLLNALVKLEAQSVEPVEIFDEEPNDVIEEAVEEDGVLLFFHIQ